jgi:PAS domain S-box-containing protein
VSAPDPSDSDSGHAVVGAGPDAPVGILIVDDRAENRLAVRAVLSSPGYRLVEAASGDEALRRLLDDEFAVLLVDVVMPGMSGFELASAIRQRERTATTPILFLTGQATDLDFVSRGYGVGAVDYLLKPLVPEMVRGKTAVFAQLYRQRKRIEQQAAQLVEAGRRESELRLVELRLASERRYRNLAEAVPHVVWTARPDGSVDYFNHRWYEQTGISAERAAGSWQIAVHADDVALLGQRWREALEAGRTFEAECRLWSVAVDGYRWHLLRAVPEEGPGGRVVSWLGTFTDIEDHKRAHAVLAEFKATLDAVLDAVMIFDPGSWRFLYVNQGARLLYGDPGDELAWLRPYALLADYDETRFRELLAPLRDGSKSAITVETGYRRRDGKLIPVEISFQLVPSGDHVVSIARDIADRKLVEMERAQLYGEALAAVEARDEFMSVASHELRTPLSSLKLQVEMLLRPPRSGAHGPPFTGKVREKLERMERQIGRLSRLVTDLMDVSRIGAGRLALELEDLDFVVLVGDVVARFKEDAAKAGCTTTVSAEGPVTGRWDRLRIEQVVTNLLANALKYGAGKPVEMTIARDGPAVRLTVRDHGIGIAPLDAERIFERFERTDAASKHPGLGLGLYIARQIVAAHGGAIRVESEPSEGSTFIVELPVITPPRERDGRREDGPLSADDGAFEEPLGEARPRH